MYKRQGIVCELPLYVILTAEAVTVSVSALAGAIATRAELVSEKLVSFRSETRILQVPLDLFMVTDPVEELILQAVLVLVS